MVAYDFPVLGLFLSMLIFFLWIVWIILLFRVVVDIFRSDDLSGVGKAFWLIFVVVLPYLGVFVYVVGRGSAMGRRAVEVAEERAEAVRTYVRSVANEGGVADELTKLAELRDKGVLTEAEFAAQKARILS